MKFIDIAIKDLYQLFKDWKTAIFLLVAPILFTLLFGFMFGGFGNPNANVDNRLPVQIVAEEQTPITSHLIEYLKNSKVIKIESVETSGQLDQLKESVDAYNVAAVLVIPAGFTEQLHSNGKVTLQTILKEETTAGVTVLQEIQTASSRVQASAHAAQITTAAYSQIQNNDASIDEDTLYSTAFKEALTAWETPPVTAIETQTAPDGSQATLDENAFAQSLPGMMAQFAIAGLMGAATIIVQERKCGAYDRLLGTAVPKFAILTGHWLAMFGMIFLQFFVLVIFGQLFLRLDFFAAPWATLLLSITSCAFVASLGLLIGILAKEPEHSAILALIPMFLFSGLGGAWVPLDILGEQVQQISRFTPIYWIMTGFREILLRGGKLSDIHVSLLALIAFSVLFFVPAVVLFYRKRT
jgi:ABC-type multidrug transport system permease subunit